MDHSVVPTISICSLYNIVELPLYKKDGQSGSSLKVPWWWAVVQVVNPSSVMSGQNSAGLKS